MGQWTTLQASDGHAPAAWRADPVEAPVGAVVFIQEIFGVNDHIRDLCDRYAELGYVAIAPALFDRQEKNVSLGYEPADIDKGRAYKATANEDLDLVMHDVEAARIAVAGSGRVGVTGFCWGGVVTWAAACRLDFQAASSFYGAGIVPLLGETPRCPTILHFGRNDGAIPMADVETIAEAHPDCPVYVYEAGHGFHCDRRGDFHAPSAHVAAMRTFRLFENHLAKG